MKASEPALYERSQDFKNEIVDYIKNHSFEVAEAYKNIFTALEQGKIKAHSLQDAHNQIYGSRRANFQLIPALEYIHGQIIHQGLSLEEVFKRMGIENIPKSDPRISQQQETTHGKIARTAPDISKEFVEAVNQSNL